jgi:HAD superfamily hydrolase (TIGR01549 family)
VSDRPTVLLDVDGTLVDATYHHAWTWSETLRDLGAYVPFWRIHRAVGMGGDQLVRTLLGDEWNAEHGEAAREGEKARFEELRDQVQPLPGAAEFVRWLADEGHPVLIASSGSGEAVEFHVGQLGIEDALTGWTSADDVETSKPEPDVVHGALERAGNPEEAVLIGDATHDVVAGRRAGIPVLTVLTGGFSGAELLDAGADSVWSDLPDLRENVRKTPIIGRSELKNREQ